MGQVKQYSITRTKFIIVVILFVTSLIVVFLSFRTQGKTTALTCKSIGRTNIHKGDKDYYASLDSDHDNTACESN